jgi:hypothetical protein
MASFLLLCRLPSDDFEVAHGGLHVQLLQNVVVARALD